MRIEDFRRSVTQHIPKEQGVGKLKEKLAHALAAHREELVNLAKTSGAKVVSQVSVEQILQGAKGIPSLLCDTSSVPPEKGLIIRGRPVGTLTDRLPEEIFCLLLTGELPDPPLLQDLREELARFKTVPAYVWQVLDAMPADSHPMVMLNTLILVQQRESVFARRYSQGMPKSEYGSATLEDALALIARVPILAAAIYRKKFNKGPRIESDPTLDWGANFARMLGVPDPKGEFTKLVQLYLVLHCDHESGNVSAATAAAVNSALSDLYYALSAGLNGLAGPLHGLANQECLAWILGLLERYKGAPSEQQIAQFAEETVCAKRVIPGYGHGVLRSTDPRFVAFLEFGKRHFPDEPLLLTVQRVFEIVPAVLKEKTKIKSPWPNVDASSGACLYHYGLKEIEYYTVLFAVSRTLGIGAQAVIARGLGMNLVRPSSVTTEWLKKACL